MAPEMPREQEQSIKARKKELFDAEAPSEGPRRRFSEYIRETAPSPLPQGLKIALWAIGAAVLLLFLTALLTSPGARGRAPAHARTDARQAGGR